MEQTAILTKYGTFSFDSEEKCKAAKGWIENAKNKVVQGKLDQLDKLLDLEPILSSSLSSSSLSSSDDQLPLSSNSIGCSSNNSIHQSINTSNSPSRAIIRERISIPPCSPSETYRPQPSLLTEEKLKTSYNDYNDDVSEEDAEEIVHEIIPKDHANNDEENPLAKEENINGISDGDSEDDLNYVEEIQFAGHEEDI